MEPSPLSPAPPPEPSASAAPAAPAAPAPRRRRLRFFEPSLSRATPSELVRLAGPCAIAAFLTLAAIDLLVVTLLLIFCRELRTVGPPSAGTAALPLYLAGLGALLACGGALPLGLAAKNWRGWLLGAVCLFVGGIGGALALSQVRISSGESNVWDSCLFGVAVGAGLGLGLGLARRTLSATIAGFLCGQPVGALAFGASFPQGFLQDFTTRGLGEALLALALALAVGYGLLLLCLSLTEHLADRFSTPPDGSDGSDQSGAPPGADP